MAETPVSRPVRGPAPGDQQVRDLATDGSMWLAVWSDGREPETGTTYAARIAASGAVLDPAGMRLLEGYGESAVAFGGGRWLVVDASLDFALVTRDGVVEKRGRVAEEIGGEVSVAFNGREFVVFWGYQLVRVATVGVDGRVLAEPVMLAAPGWLQKAACNTSRCVVLYGIDAGLFAAITTAGGAPIETGVPLAQHVSSASIVSNGDELLVAMRRWSGELAVRRLDANGMPSGDEVVVRTNVTDELALATTGDAYTLWFGEGEPTRLLAMPLARDLTAGPTTVVLEHPERWVDGVAAAGTLAIAHLHHRDQPYLESEIYTSSGALVTRAASAQRAPKVALGDGTLVVWEEDRGGGAQPRSQVYASTGGEAFAVAPSERAQSQIAVAAEDDAFLVAWSEASGGVFARIVRGGEPFGDVLALDTGYAWAPVVASDGRDFVLAWIVPHEFGYRLARVTTGGELLARTDWKQVRWVTGPGPHALACANGECLFAWMDATTYSTCPRILCITVEYSIKGVRFGAQLEALDAPPLVLAEKFEPHELALAAAGDGSYAIAAERNWTTGVRTLARDGTLSREVVRDGRQPALARQGNQWLLVRELDHRIVAMRFDATSSGSDLTLFRDAQARLQPDVASDGTRATVVYERTTRDEPAGGVARVYVSTIEPPRGRTRAVGH